MMFWTGLQLVIRTKFGLATRKRSLIHEGWRSFGRIGRVREVEDE